MEKATHYFVLVLLDIRLILESPSVTGILNFPKIIIFEINFRFDGSNIVLTVGSNHDHYFTSLGSMKNVPIAVGSYSPGNKKVERLQDGQWNTMGDFPFVDRYICYYSFATFNGGIYIFGKIFVLIFIDFLKIKFNLGGYADGGYSNLVAKMDENGFDRDIWTKMETLLTTRYGHRSMVLNNKIVHIGGKGETGTK